MGDETMYPARPGIKEPGGASEVAAVATASRAKTLRGAVLQMLHDNPRGLTADEIAARLDETPFTIRPRVSELVKMGLATKTAERRRNTSGMSASVHIATPPQQ